jgi:hypothetical protein
MLQFNGEQDSQSLKKPQNDHRETEAERRVVLFNPWAWKPHAKYADVMSQTQYSTTVEQWKQNGVNLINLFGDDTPDEYFDKWRWYCAVLLRPTTYEMVHTCRVRIKDEKEEHQVWIDGDDAVSGGECWWPIQMLDASLDPPYNEEAPPQS